MKIVPFEDRHKDGSLHAKGQTRNGVAVGYWEWFRKDGSKLRSGHFKDGIQTGVWITYDRNGKEYKRTVIAAKKAAKEKVTLTQIAKRKGP